MVSHTTNESRDKYHGLPQRILKYLTLSLYFTSIVSCVEYKVLSIRTPSDSGPSILTNSSQPLVVVSLYKAPSDHYMCHFDAALDSIAGAEAIAYLTDVLMDSPFFLGSSIPAVIHYRTDDSRYIPTFPWRTVEELCAPHGADLLISLEYIRIQQETKFFPYIHSSPKGKRHLKMFYGELKMSYYIKWRVYDLKHRKVLASNLLNDTITWNKSDFKPIIMGGQIPDFFSAAAYCGSHVGSEYADIISPKWLYEDRIVFLGGSPEMRRAARLAFDGRWLDAAALWQQVISNPQSAPSLAARAAFNMAIANEIRSNYDVALAWLNKSLGLTALPQVRWYIDTIEVKIMSQAEGGP